MRSILHDVRFAYRMLAKNLGITLVAIFTLGLGIGANTAAFSLSNTFLRKPISFPGVERLAMVLNRAPGQQDDDWSGVSVADFLEWRKENRSFAGLAGYEWADVNLTGAGEPVKAQGFRVTPDFFDVLGIRAALGRGFVAGEDIPGQDARVILSHGLWTQQFASDPRIVGKTVKLDGRPCEIVGVMSQDMNFPASAALWIPMAFRNDEKQDRSSHNVHPLGRLKSGVSLQQAQAEMNAIQERLTALYPAAESGWRVTVQDLGKFVAGHGRGYMLLMLGSVGFVLLIACANVTNLLLVRSTSRQNELAIRRALGGSRARVIRQLLVESLLLGMCGSIAGLLLGAWGISLLRGNMPPEVSRYIPGWNQVGLDREVFLYTLGVACAAGIIAGLVPAFQGSDSASSEVLRAGQRAGGSSRSRARLRNAFIAAEISLSLVLLVGAVLMSKGVRTLFASNFKSDPQSVLTMRVSLPESKYATSRQRAVFYDRFLERIRELHEVEFATVAGVIPYGYNDDTPAFSIEGQPKQLGEQRTAERNAIGPDYFRLLHVRLVEGREFDDRDTADSPRVAIVSESMAHGNWPGISVLGRRVKIGEDDSKDPWATVVGVVENVDYSPWEHDLVRAVYFPYRQDPQAGSYIAIRTFSDLRSIMPAVRSILFSVDPDQPVFDVLPFDRVISDQILGLAYVAVVMAVLGLMALVMSAIGVSSVMAYSVTQRIQEIGLRMALGARPRHVLGLFLGGGLKLLAIGTAIGLPAAFALARLLSSLFYGVRAADFFSYASGAILLAVVVVLGCYIPARRATRVDPMRALRYE
jgi:putative ABC transport system permease protein